ncbi:hypothetical protein TNIN_62331 [Trichonephila inaurata madagascariensis]|uniref:Uncharacterized protein n=1 Tax=Trichonephila inaurata madagascariensis TaxID=2747483 RepID=A0A8X7CEQ3_9ARAC|nr:hypothetical protein TNIN_62331 [Trichonephila inaurata madagascariensis]
MLTLGYRSPDTSAGNLSVPSGQQVGVETCQRIAGSPVHIPNVHCGSPSQLDIPTSTINLVNLRHRASCSNRGGISSVAATA